MLGKSILLYTGDRAGAKRLTVPLRASGNEVVTLTDPGAAIDLIAARAVDLVLLDHDDAPYADQALVAAGGQVPVIALSSNQDPSMLLDLVCEYGVNNVLARRREGEGTGLSSVATRELVVTAEKILRGNLFGIDKYLPHFGLEQQSYVIREASHRDEIIETLQAYLKSLGGGRELCSAMGLVADELITNAIYNAPRDPQGRPRYAALNRREKIVLESWEQVRVDFASDGQMFALAVSDSFGSLTAEHMRASLRRCLGGGDQIEQKAGGAGLGLYTVLSSVSQLVVNVVPNVRTETIAMIELDRRMKGIRSAGHSLHLFMAPRRVPREKQQAVPTRSIALSDSMRYEIRTAAAPAAKNDAGGVIPLVKRKEADTEKVIIDLEQSSQTG